MVALHIPFPSPRAAALAARRAESRDAADYDAILIQRFNGGDEAAFTEIVTRYREKMLHVAFRRLNNRADAEEIVQDTFIRAHRRLANFRGEASLAAWLYRIAVNLSCNRHWYFFRRARHVTMSLDASVSDANPASLGNFIPDRDTSPVQAACLGEFAGTIARCMAQLPAGQREILVLRNVQHQSYAHIGRVLGIRVGTAKSRIGRARATLRALLAATYPELRQHGLSPACFEPSQYSPSFEPACA
jgi:RNA polymerase sigma-70 factor (ECF subfamily)